MREGSFKGELSYFKTGNAIKSQNNKPLVEGRTKPSQRLQQFHCPDPCSQREIPLVAPISGSRSRSTGLLNQRHRQRAESSVQQSGQAGPDLPPSVAPAAVLSGMILLEGSQPQDRTLGLLRRDLRSRFRSRTRSRSIVHLRRGSFADRLRRPPRGAFLRDHPTIGVRPLKTLLRAFFPRRSALSLRAAP